MNAIMHANHRRILDQEFGRVWVQYWATKKFSVPMLFCIYSNATSNGSDPTRV